MIVENKSETLWPNIFLDILLFIFCVVCVISWWQIDRFSELQLNIIKLQGFISIRSMINCPPAAAPARVGFKIIQNSSRPSVKSMLWVFNRMHRNAFCLKTFNFPIRMSYCQKKCGRRFIFYQFVFVFKSLPRVFQECSKSVPRVFQEYSKSVPREFQECSESLPRIFQESSKSLSRVFQEFSKSLQRVFKESSKSLPRVFQESSKSLPRVS